MDVFSVGDELFVLSMSIVGIIVTGITILIP